MKNKVIFSLFWKILERGGTQGIQFLIQIVLARLLLPEEFGTIAIVSAFISISRVFIDSGFSTSLIQKKDSDNLDYSSVFILSFSVSLFLYIMLYFFSPIIANFYNNESLVGIIRVLSISLLIGSYNSVQNAFISKNLLFKKLFISTIFSMLISGILSIVLAYKGFGVWSLVLYQLLSQFLLTFILFIYVKWRPELKFSKSRIKVLFNFGSKLLVSSLLDTIYNELRTFYIGKSYSSEVLGYYNRGEQFPRLIAQNINGSIQTVMLPTMSMLQDDSIKLKYIVKKSILVSSFLVFPVMIGLAIIAKPLIILLLTDKWLFSVPFLQVFCLSYALLPIHTANLQAINAIGRSDVFLKLEIIKKLVGIAIFFISIPFGVLYIAIGLSFSSVISSFINAFPNKKFLNYGYVEQIRDILPNIMISVIMSIPVYLISFIDLQTYVVLIMQVVIGILLYLFLAFITKNYSFIYLKETIVELIRENTRFYKQNKK